MAMWAQPEDKMWPELYDALRNREPRHSEYRKHQSFQAAIARGGSGNWPWLSYGITASVGEGTTWALQYLSRPHDWDLNEPCTDDFHNLYILCGKTAARDALLGRNGMAATRLTEDLLQNWAVAILCSTEPLNPGKNWVVPPGARASSPKTERSIREYLFLRALGWSHDQIRRMAVTGRRMCRIVERTYAFQEVSLKAVIDQLADSFASDMERVYGAFRAVGFPALSTFLTHGTRVPFEFLRTVSGYAAVMTQNCNANDGPRWAAVGTRDGVVQFPTKKVSRRQFENGGAAIMRATRKVSADGEHSGHFLVDFPPGDIVAHFKSAPDGWTSVTNKIPFVQTPPSPPSLSPPPPKPSLRRRFLNWLGEIF